MQRSLKAVKFYHGAISGELHVVQRRVGVEHGKARGSNTNGDVCSALHVLNLLEDGGHGLVVMHLRDKCRAHHVVVVRGGNRRRQRWQTPQWKDRPIVRGGITSMGRHKDTPRDDASVLQTQHLPTVLLGLVQNVDGKPGNRAGV